MALFLAMIIGFSVIGITQLGPESNEIVDHNEDEHTIDIQ